MIHKAVAVGPLQCNCHILADESTKEAVVLDPGDDSTEIIHRLDDLKVVAILHTHCHFDHMTATRRVAEKTGAEILIHQADKDYYDSLAGQYRMFGMPRDVEDPLPVKRFLKHGEKIRFGKQHLTVIHTPGHTQGSCSFHTEGLVVSGDTLFRGSIGRSDLPGGNFEEELDSIRKRLYTLDPETVVYPGHGPETSIRDERRENPFVTG